MRILKLAIKSLGTIALILIVVGLAARELVLFISLRKVKDSLELVKEISEGQTKATDCMGRGSVSDNEGLFHQTQLRFVSDNEYVIEVVCNQFPLSPIKVTSDSLFTLVKKEKGHSGIIWGVENPGIQLFLLGRAGAVFAENGEVRLQVEPHQDGFHSGPISECVSFGYYCCNASSQSGVGDYKKGVLDCPKACYESCEDRPLVLKFLTQPYYDQLTHQLKINSGTEVTFNYTVSLSQGDAFSTSSLSEDANILEQIVYQTSHLFNPSQSQDQQAEVIIDFGDGESSILRDLQGKATHVYTCNKTRCEYQAQLTAVNGQGVKSIQDLASSIKIVVK